MRPPKLLIRAMGRAQAWVYRRSGGRLLARFGHADVLLLTTTGRRTGVARTVPLLYLDDDGTFVVVGSVGGHDTDPAWVVNLRAEPRASIQVGAHTMSVAAREADDATRERLWGRLVDMYPGYETYRGRTTRRIPIMLLEPHDAP